MKAIKVFWPRIVFPCNSFFLAAISFGLSGEDSQFKNCKDDFRCGISGKCIFQIFIFGEIFEINGWSAIVEVEKKVRSIIIDAKIGKLVQNRCVENRALACLWFISGHFESAMFFCEIVLIHMPELFLQFFTERKALSDEIKNFFLCHLF